MAKRLQGVLDASPVVDLTEELDEDYESLDETAEEFADGEDDPAADAPGLAKRSAPPSRTRSTSCATSKHWPPTSATTPRARRCSRPGPGIRRTGSTGRSQEGHHLHRIQAHAGLPPEPAGGHAYGDGIVLFNGTNSDARAQAIYKDWLKRHEGTDHITGSKTADTRAALVEHFKERGTVMIATEAGAEGINLQFCSLVINYDLPWNPQRIEQRIGRCHRYGQKHDVVVVNFVDRSNEADARVYELLEQKFQLFDGVFGASDEVLGAIGSGVDFERRIADIYQNCRNPSEIKASFEQLQLDLSGEISEAMVKTRQILLENFDEEVQDKLRVRAEDSRSARSRFERMLMDLSRAELGDCASFDDDGFQPAARAGRHRRQRASGIELGRYELPRRSGDAHLYRINHPLALWIAQQAKTRTLDRAKLVFDYDGYGTQGQHAGAVSRQGWMAHAEAASRSKPWATRSSISAGCGHHY
jgi:hypothetical protein